MYTYKYPRPAVTTDAVVWGLGSGKDDIEVLLIKRKNHPFQGHYALPGGFLDEGESAEECVVRELAEETGLTGITLVQMRTFSQPGRDPRGHTVSVVFFSMIDKAKYSIEAGDDAAQVEWVSLLQIHRDKEKYLGQPEAGMVNESDAQGRPEAKLLAFDHYDIIAYSALFVYRHLFLGCGFQHPESMLYPFSALLEAVDKNLIKAVCTEFRQDYAKFIGK